MTRDIWAEGNGLARPRHQCTICNRLHGQTAVAQFGKHGAKIVRFTLQNCLRKLITSGEESLKRLG
jgi:hypothetical protein